MDINHHYHQHHGHANHHSHHNGSHNSQHIVHSGWLMKSPPEKRLWKTKWRRRWFVLKLSGQIPGQYVLEYYMDENCKKLKGTIDLDQCEQVDAGLQLEIRKENFEFMFDLRTTKRVYYLVASSDEDMNKWVECICSVCGLKMEAVQNELALLPPMAELSEERYSPQPSQSDSIQLQTAPTPPPPPPTSQHSNVVVNLHEPSLNYIPISECYTGKPNSNSPPPPRPPKPRALQLAGKSQSSLALWPAESTPTHPVRFGAANTLDLRRSPRSSVNPPVLINDRPLYLNHSSPINQSASHQYEFCNGGTVVINQQGNGFEAPPMVNRDLKPHRRHGPGRSSIDSTNPNPFGSQASRHTLPRPPPSYPIRGDDTRKSFNQNHHTNSNFLSHHLAIEKVASKLPPSYLMGNHAQVHDSSNAEIQYLDLDLESNSESTNSQSPRTPFTDSTSGTNGGVSDLPNNLNQPITWNIPPNNNISNNNNNNNAIHHGIHMKPHQHNQNPIHHNNNNNVAMPNANHVNALPANNHCNSSSTVYKKVDFVKTQAFNKMRSELDMNQYRSGQPSQ
ncbi:hypothetical protein RDWZM_005981 [Blomia tropicalis]|uniref:PH domain-containing protein n=1 Tax=Blomia tropicalis TaxID=40697 RepID=A0A9Q0M779_BLOTA|nr:hypothetical protein RDWZM_005981 [Blomia tropicalis]